MSTLRTDTLEDTAQTVSVAVTGLSQATALRTDLSNTADVAKGSALVGFKQTGVGASARTVFSKLKECVSVLDFGAVGDGVADDTAAIQAAITHIGTITGGGEVVFPNGVYNITSTLSLVSDLKLTGYKAKIVSTNPIAIQALAKQNITISDLEIQGPGPATMGAVAEDGGINLGNVTSTNGCTNVAVRDCHVHSFYTGISVRYGNKCSIVDNEVNNFTLYGAMLSRTQDFTCSRNEIHDSVVNTGTNSYCISATGGSEVASPQRRCSITDNKLYNAPAWSAIMSHDIADMVISGNIIDNVRNGIDVSVAANKAISSVVITGNRIVGTTTDTWGGSAASNSGIFMATGGTVEVDIASDIAIVGNVISGFGRFQSGSQACGAILCSNVFGASIVGNVLSQQSNGVATSVAGIFIGSVCKDIAISGNSIKTDTKPPIQLATTTNARNISITGNNLYANSSASAVLVTGSTIGQLNVQGNNHNSALSGYAESGTNVIDGVSASAPYGGRGVASKKSARVQGNSVTSLAAGGTATLVDVTVPGAVIGDTVAVGYAAQSAGVIVYGYVTGANTVRVELYNGTGVSLTKAAATVSVDLWKHS